MNEAFNVEEEQYGDERLEAFLTAHASMHPRTLVGAMANELSAWAEGAEQSDDITMVCLEYGVPPEATGTLTVPATLDKLEDVTAVINDELAARLCPITAQLKIDMACEELFVNICEYAYAGQEKPGNVRLDYVYNTNPSALTVSLTDWGVPFDPLSVGSFSLDSDEDITLGGMGILLAKQSVDDMSYVREGDTNVIAFRKAW